jgi:hypothetical protein
MATPSACYTEALKERCMRKRLRPWRTISGKSTWQPLIAVSRKRGHKNPYKNFPPPPSSSFIAALFRDHGRRETGKTFADGVEDADMKVQLLLGGQKILNDTLRQAFEPQVVFLAARPRERRARTYWGRRSSLTK